MKGLEKHKAELLKKWLQGDAGLKEEQQLEKYAANDPFLAEAMEGYTAIPEGEHIMNIQAIKDRLQQKEDRRTSPVVLFYLPRIAAAIAVLIVSVALFQWINQDTATNNIVENVPPPQETPATESAAVKDDQAIQEQPPTTSKEEEVVVDKPAPKTAKKSTPQKRKSETSKSTKKKIGKSNAAKEKVASPDLYAQEEELPQMDDLADKMVFDEVTVQPSAPVAIQQDRLPSIRPNILTDSSRFQLVQGSVVNQEGEPLIGATISQINSNTNTFTDLNGRFALRIEEVDDSPLQISYTGYEDQQIEPKLADNLKVVLNESQEVEDVNVTALRKSKARIQEQRNSIQKADLTDSPKPIVGFDNYLLYIQKELNYPPMAEEAKIEGAVKLQFRIDGSGTPTDFKVIESLGYGCDAEAMFIIKNGPKWDKPGMVTYSVKFEL